MKKNNHRGLYIHIPFCQHICAYCDFCKMQYFSNLASQYLQVLKKELDFYQIEEVETIYVGGGTPTSLDLNQLLFLLKILFPYYKKGMEYTFETNVETLNIEKLRLLKQYGVNRLSIGVESSDDKILLSLNRHHNFDDVVRVVKESQKLGFDNINVDLILGLPNTNLESLKKDLDNLIKLNIQHISTYSLTISPHTLFYSNKIKEPSQDTCRQQYDYVHNFLLSKGFIHYEISNFSMPSYFSKHNLIYWRDKEYYGIGLGASGYIDGFRYQNTKSINEYLQFNFIKEKEKINLNDDIEYYIMLNLRTDLGIDLKEFTNKFNFDLNQVCGDIFFKYINKGLMKKDNNRVYLTYEGMMILDTIVIDLLLKIDKYQTDYSRL